MTYDGYIFPPQLVSKFGDAGVDLAKVAVLRPFNRNFIKDKWSEDGRECHFDRRWDGLLFKILAYLPAFNKNQDSIILKAVSDSSLEWNSTAVPYIHINNSFLLFFLFIYSFVIESPPLFLQDYGVPQPNIFGCLVSGSINWDSYKTIIISLEDEGLTVSYICRFFFTKKSKI
jgi:hypothetical protein